MTPILNLLIFDQQIVRISPPGTEFMWSETGIQMALEDGSTLMITE